ncbi:hypothetical protein Tco_0586440 [Tanacetum coccineum]
MEAIQAFLKKYDQIPPKEKSMALLLAEERFLKIKQVVEEEQTQPENIQELLLKLINDFQILNGIQLKQEEQAAKVSSQYWKPPIFYNDDDDDDEESSIPLRDIISKLPLSVAITPDLPITDSLIMEDDILTLFRKRNRTKKMNTLMVSSPKIESLLEEFFGELAHIDLILPGIDEADFDPEDDIRHVENLLYDNSSPRPPKELNFKFFDAIIDSFSPSPIPVEDSDSLMEEIDIFLAPDDLIPPDIENDDYDSEGDVLFLEELLNDDSISLHEYESFHVDFYNVPSSPHPLEKPPDDDVYFDIEPCTGVLTTKVVDDISDN